MIAYLLKSACCLAFLLAFYHLVLEREKMHQFNRFYLLGSVLFSFLAPLFIIYIQIPVSEVIEIPLAANEPVILTVEEVAQNNNLNYWNIALGISVIVSLLLSIRFGINLFKIFRKVRTNTKLKVERAILVLVEDTISPHTFWNYIFINKNEYNSHKIEDELFTHELTHATQKHTFDVLLIEVLKIVFWFNPLFYFLKRSIQLNHEFIADEKVINSYKNISEYQYLLLNKAAWNNDYYLASNLNYSLTKKRLVMMTTKTSKVNNWLKKIAVIPLLMGSLYVFAERVEKHDANIETSKEEMLDNKSVNLKETQPSIAITDSIPKVKKIVNRKKGYFTYTAKDGTVVSKKISELTEEEKKMIPPPPVPKAKIKGTKVAKRVKVAEPVEVEVIEVSNKTQKKAKAPKPVKKTKEAKTTQVKSPEKPKKGWHYVNNQTLYFIKDKNGTKYFNRWGQLVTKEGKVINQKQTQSNNTAPNQNSSNASKDTEVAGEFRRVHLPPPPPKAGFPKVKKGDVTNIPPPPRRIRPEEYVKKHKKATFYFNNKKVSYKKALRLVKKEKLLHISTQEDKGKKVIKFVTKKAVDKGLVYKNKQKPSNNEVLNLFQNSNENISYYLDEKKISKLALEKMNSDDIASISVKRNKDNSKSIYLISKK